MHDVNNKNSAIVSDFGLRFRLLMSYHNLTLKEIAAFTNNATSTVGTWKNGRIPTSHEVVTRLAELFQVSEEFLLKGRSRTSAHYSETANEILRNIETLLHEIQCDEKSHHVEESQASYGNKPGISKERLELEAYFSHFLKEAEKYPGGLAHARCQLKRDFPQDLFEQHWQNS